VTWRVPGFALRGVRRFAWLPVGAVLAAGCGGSDSTADPDPPVDGEPIEVPARGTAASFDVGTWNLDWFGDTGNGPSDEALQLRHVRDVLNGTALDLWALQEVVDQEAFDALVTALPGFSGLLADDPSVAGGPEWYRDFGDREQKVALLYRTSVVTVRSARVILTAENFAFAGRPPLEVEISVALGGAPVNAVVLVLHAKAAADAASRDRRQAGSEALQVYLEQRWPTTPVWVLGDFNDDVDTSITPGRPSPYANFVAAPDWSFATATLSRQGVSSTVGFDDVIDHHLVSDEAGAWYVTGSAEAYRVDQWVPSYARSTTDHYPVLTRYALPGG
jgi:endonuclease/exonuclease/phosphatase family metal-dependent hydrolase